MKVLEQFSILFLSFTGTNAWVVSSFQRCAANGLNVKSSAQVVGSQLLWMVPLETPENRDGEIMPTSIEEERPPMSTPVKIKRPVATQARQMSPIDVMSAMGTSPRRIFVSFLSASGIALAGNFLGVTSRILTAVPEDVVEASYLDTYFPRGEYKRIRGKGYTFVIPQEWVADTFIELAKAQRRTQSLDLSMKQRRESLTTLPDAAFGPAGRLNKKGVSESGDTNVSVIVSSGLKDFSLRKQLGEPQAGAEFLIRVSIAPEGSGRVATLLNAFEDSKTGAYQFEYIVERRSGPPLRNISVVAANPDGSSFYTMTVVAPAKEWENPEYAEKLKKMAESFHLVL